MTTKQQYDCFESSLTERWNEIFNSKQEKNDEIKELKNSVQELSKKVDKLIFIQSLTCREKKVWNEICGSKICK